MVDDLAVLAEGNILHSVDICRIIHIIVGFDRQPDFSPSFDLAGDGLFAVFAMNPGEKFLSDAEYASLIEEIRKYL